MAWATNLLVMAFLVCFVAGAVEKLEETRTAVLHIGLKVMELSFFLYRPFYFSAVVDLVDTRPADSARSGLPAVLQPEELCVVLPVVCTALEKQNATFFDLIVPADHHGPRPDCGSEQKYTGVQGSLTGDLIGIVLNAMLIEIFDLFRHVRPYGR